MLFKYTYLVPILCTVWLLATFIITYVTSVYRKDVTPIFPYVSDTGSWPPESCLFGLALNIGAIMFAFWAFCRYLHIEYLISKDTLFVPLVKRNNLISFYTGAVAAFGICVLANFQISNVFAVHMIGAVTAFASSCIYQCMQTRISFQLYPYVGNKKNNFAKLACAVISCITFIITFTCGLNARVYFKGTDMTKWTKSDGGHLSHLISVIAEWILVICSVSFPIFYTHEMKKMWISEPSMSEKV